MFQVVSTAEADRWWAAYNKLPLEMQDVHFSPAYYAAHETAEQLAQCAILEDERGVVMYPFLRCAISDSAIVPSGERWYDLQGALGYNGMAASVRDEACIRQFHEEFSGHCQRTRVVAELTRLNPALNADEFARGFLTITTVNRNVLVDLTRSEDELWRSGYAYAARKQINKAKRNGLVTRRGDGDADIAAFHAVFQHTMERNQAAAAARHPIDYFRQLATGCGRHVTFYLTEHAGRAVAAELVTHGETVAYSFLGGTLDEAFPLGGNDILKHDIIVDLKRRGFKTYCLGGGLSPGDGIYRYKEKFSVDGGVDFHLGSRIHAPEVFQSLVAAWAEAYPDRVAKGQGKVLPYRF